jgi:hypothetical protein
VASGRRRVHNQNAVHLGGTGDHADVVGVAGAIDVGVVTLLSRASTRGPWGDPGFFFWRAINLVLYALKSPEILW